MIRFANSSVTYEQLSQVLAQLGFTRTDTAEYIAFRNEAHDALLALPVLPPEQRVDAAHLSAVQATVIGKGIASENTLTKLLRQVSTDISDTEAKPQQSESA